MSIPQRVCIFCASSPAIDPLFFEVAHELALDLLNNQIAIHYGGGKSGLMGKIADTYISGNGEITGYYALFHANMSWGHPRD